MEELNNVDVSPVKKNPCGKFVGVQQKEMIINLHKSKMIEQAKLPDEQKLKYIDLIKLISKEIGIGQRTISTTLSEYRKKGTVSPPNKKKKRLTVIEKLDDFDKNFIRQKIHGFWLRKEIPTLYKILVSINDDSSLPNFSRTSLRKILNDLNFEYTKKNHISALTEKGNIVCWRQKYIEDIRYYRSRGRPIYYLDETLINTAEINSKPWVDNTIKSNKKTFIRGHTTGKNNLLDKDKLLNVVHIGSSEGFVIGGLLTFESKKKTIDNNDEMNGDIFYDWFSGILPLLKENAVIVMDNAPYHSIKKDKFPLISWKKEQIILWLENKGKIIDRPMVKHRLLEEAEQFRPLYNKYMIDELAMEQNKIILRLPPYHRELNPIEFAWSSIKQHVKMNYMTHKLLDVQKLVNEGVERVTPEMWKSFISHVIDVENTFYDIDFISDELLDADLTEPITYHGLTMIRNTSDSEVESDN